MLTCELAYMSRPPMGEKMTPTIKNRGRTFLGVKMGLSHVLAGGRAGVVVRVGVNLLPCFQTLLPEGGICCRFSMAVVCAQSNPCPRQLLLGGLLLFAFFGSSRVGSWLVMESAWSTCCVRDIVLNRRESARRLGGLRVLWWWLLEEQWSEGAGSRERPSRCPKLVTDEAAPRLRS